MMKAAQWRWSVSAAALGAAVVMLLAACAVQKGGGSGAEAAAAEKASFPFQDAALPMVKRAEDQVGRMTLEEKIGQMQMDSPAIERLGVPAYHWWNEALHGVARNGTATVFPQAIGLAAAWNTDLHHRVAQAIGVEARAKHQEAVRKGVHGIYTGLDLWSPNINIFRDPRWGRGQETYGEDPYLTGRLGVAFVTGLQGDDPVYFQTIATPKHFAVHSGPESDRHRMDMEVSPRDLWETYLPAFEACVREGKAYSVMGAYNRLDGVPCCANEWLLADILRKKWGFQGYVTSDVGAIADICVNHQFTDTTEEAAAEAVKAGCDLDGGAMYGDLLGAVKMGMISEGEIDVAVKRVMLGRLRLGLLDVPERGPYAQTAYGLNDSREHEALAREAARQSMVLLRNEGGALPLRKDLGTVAVIGPTADNVAALVGNYNGTPARPVTILQGVRNAVSPGTRVLYAAGSPLVGEMLPLEEVVPGDCLFTDITRAVPGLRGDYFKNTTLAGRPQRTRMEKGVDFDWGEDSPRAAMPTEESFSARWTGVLVPPVSGTYQLGMAATDGFRVYLDGRRVAEDWSAGGWRSAGGRVTLEKGKSYALCVEYFHAKDEAAVQLKWTRPGGEPFYAEAVRIAQRADSVVMVLGLTAGLEREQDTSAYEGFVGGDRQTLDLPGVQEELLEAVCATGKPVTLVLTGGSALSVNWAAAHVPGIVEAWYPGEQGGNGVADVLFGDANPAGRLPVTFYKSVTDLPMFENYSMQGRTYRYFKGKALWEFGYGLSYTRFANGEMEAPAEAKTGEDVTVRVKVKNVGERVGDEVVQLYVSRAGEGAAIRSLAGFARVALKAGEEKAVEFTLTPRQLGVADEHGDWWEQSGEVRVEVGGSSAGGKAKTVQLQGNRAAAEYRYVAAQVK